MNNAEAVAALDALTGDDPEVSHGLADDVLLSVVHPDVRSAYIGLQNRCKWWATA